jgi:hypothetical protein
MKYFLTIWLVMFSIHCFAQHDWDSKNWNKKSLGFGCSVDGQMTKPVLKMTQLFTEKRFDKVRQLLNSDVTADQYLVEHIANIKAEPKMYTRKEAASALRVTLPTLRVYEIQGKLIPKRAGKRVLYSKEAIENFIASLRP